MNEPRIHFSDSELYPVLAYFNSIKDEDFLEVAYSLIKKESINVGPCECEFPDLESESEDEHFEGVRFWVVLEQVTITESDFKSYFLEVCKVQLSRVPEQKKELTIIINKLTV